LLETCNPLCYGLKDCESISTYGGIGNPKLLTFYHWNKEQFLITNTYQPNNEVIYYGSIYICKNTSIGNLPTNTEYFYLFSEKKNFQKRMDDATDSIINSINRIDTMIAKIDDKPIQMPISPSTRLVPDNGDIHIIRNLFNWLFPKCEYCDRRYIRYIFKLHYSNIHICKRCCWIFDIDSVETFEIVDKIRAEVKKNVNLQSFCNMNIEVNKSKSKEIEVISH